MLRIREILCSVMCYLCSTDILDTNLKLNIRKKRVGFGFWQLKYKRLIGLPSFLYYPLQYRIR